MWRITTFVFLFVTFIFEEAHAKPHVPCFFIFGDSLSDAGNNNDLKTKAKANYPPYGVDFVGQRPTGRFTNGQTTVDVIAEHLGFNGYIPPHRGANGKKILKGVNYASGSAGIRSETSHHLGERISLGHQIKNHKLLIPKIDAMLNKSGRGHLEKCLYTVTIGSNDYINNYFMPEHYKTSHMYDPIKFADILIQQYSKQLKVLYRNGARKVALFGLGQLGCTLAEIVKFKPKTLCVDPMNYAVQHFNNKLISLVDSLNHQLHGAKFTYIDTQSVVFSQELTVLNATCCNKLREDFQCEKDSSVCGDRKSYIFWDGFHTTEAANRFIGGKAFKANLSTDVHPYDITTLISLSN